MTIRFTPSARAKFLAILDRTRRENRGAAVAFRRDAESALARLRSFPESAPHIAEFPDLPHREVFVRPYRFFYRVQGEIVWVVDLWHGAQIASEPLDP